MGAARRAFVLLAIGTTVVAFGVGCGSSTSSNSSSSAGSSAGFSKYETQMQTLGQQLGAELARLGQSNVGVTPRVIAQHLVSVQIQLRSTADKLAAITPPVAIKADHALLLKGVREYADGLDALIAKLRKPTNDNLAYLNVLRGISSLKGVKDMQNASLAITKAGYLITLRG